MGIDGIPGGARARAGLDLVERFSGEIVRAERLDTWRVVSAQAHLARREGPGDGVLLDERDPGRENFVDCGMCGPCGFFAQPVDEQEVTNREDNQIRVVVTQRGQQSLRQIRCAQMDPAVRYPIPRKHVEFGVLFVVK